MQQKETGDHFLEADMRIFFLLKKRGIQDTGELTPTTTRQNSKASLVESTDSPARRLPSLLECVTLVGYQRLKHSARIVLCSTVPVSTSPRPALSLSLTPQALLVPRQRIAPVNSIHITHARYFIPVNSIGMTHARYFILPT